MIGVAVHVRRRGVGAQLSIPLGTGDVIHTSGAPRRDVLQNWAQKQGGSCRIVVGLRVRDRRGAWRGRVQFDEMMILS